MPPPTYGAIGERYKWLIDNNQNWLGNPVREEEDLDGGRVQMFERGSIYWWEDLLGGKAGDLGLVKLRYKGLYCWSTTFGAGSDEPYVTIGVASTPAGRGISQRSQIYEDVDGGNERPDDLELYVGPPYGAQLYCGLWEHDSGDQDEIHKTIMSVADEAANKGEEACEGEAGPLAGKICREVWDGYTRDVASDFLTSLLGLGDDQITTWPWYVSPKEMCRMAWTEGLHHYGITYDAESHLLKGDGADYKIYLEAEGV
jgi:hypothetical protein